MNLVTVGFVVGMSFMALLSVLGDREAYRRGVLRKSFKTLRRSPFLTKDLWRQLRDYNRPGFHPDDRDSSELVARWREELFGAEGSLTDLLPKAAA